MSKWADAYVGRESPQVAVRVTEEEKDRLEELRRELRLTSKGQVIRFALDLLERGFIATGEEPEEARRLGRRARRRAGVPRVADPEAAPSDDAVAVNKDLQTSFRHVVGGPDAVAGLPGAATDGDKGRRGRKGKSNEKDS